MGWAHCQALYIGGNPLSFDNPQLLSLLFFLIIFIPFIIVRYRNGRQKAALFAAAAPSNERKSLLKELRLRIIISDIFFLLFLMFLIIALAGPRWGLRTVTDYRRGVDVVLAFDFSRSMEVKDCLSSDGQSVSRLEQSKEIAREFAASLKDIRLGVAIGKGRGVLALPLTYDSDTVLSFLYAMDSKAVTGLGTNLESIVEAAFGAFQDFIPSRRGIVLFSDGDALSGSFQAAADKARRAGITLSVVGIGSDQGGPVPVETSPNAPEGFLVGVDGKTVISARQEDLLKSGAEKTRGIYVDGSRNDAARVLAGYINSISAESRLQGQRRETNPRWRIFLIAAMSCLGGARIMGFSRRNRKRNYLPALLCLALFSSCAKTQGKLLIMEANFLNARGYYIEAISSYLRAINYEEAVPYAEYGLAFAFFALEEGDAALERYKEAERNLDSKLEDHPELRYRIYYNRGIIHFEKGEYDEAALAFREALKVDGSRIEAKRNLELSLLPEARNSPTPAAYSRENAENGQGDGGSPVLFEYLRVKEQGQWKSREWTGESAYSGLDY